MVCSVAKSSIGVVCSESWVLGEGGVGKGRVSLPLLPLGNGGDSSLLGGVGLGKGSLGLSDLGGVNRGNGSNAIVDGGHGKTRVSDTEASSISDILDLLQDSVGIDIGVAGLSLGRVQVGVAVVQVTELILGVVLAAHVG